MNLQERIEKVFHAGWGAHEASLDSRNANGIRSIEENAITDGRATIAADLKGKLPLTQQCIAHTEYDDDCTVCAQVTGFNQAIDRTLAVIDRYCGVGI